MFYSETPVEGQPKKVESDAEKKVRIGVFILGSSALAVTTPAAARWSVSGTYEGQWLRGARHGYGVRQSVSYDLAVRFPLQSAFSAVQAGSVVTASPGLLEKEDDVLLRDRDLRVEESRGGFVLLARTTPFDRDSMSTSTSSGSQRRGMVLDKHGKPSLRKTIVSVRTSPFTARTGQCNFRYEK